MLLSVQLRRFFSSNFVALEISNSDKNINNAFSKGSYIFSIKLTEKHDATPRQKWKENLKCGVISGTK